VDVEKIYPIGARDGTHYEAVIGWSDTQQEHYACIREKDNIDRIAWQYRPIQRIESSAIMSIMASVAETWTGSADQLALSLSNIQSDLQELKEAPFQRLVDSSELENLDMLDTDYAKGPLYGNTVTPSSNRVQQLSYEDFLQIIDYGRDTDLFTDDAALEDMEQMVRDCFAELQTCVSCLKTYIETAQQQGANISPARLDNQCNSAISFTAGQLVQNNEALFRSFSLERISAIASAAENITAAIDQIYTPEEIERIDTVTVSLCGSKLTDFRQAIGERGYDPVTGLPLNCLNHSTFSWPETVEDDTVGLYVGYGLSDEEAERMVDIHRTDPRYRTDDDWEFLQTTAQNLQAITAQRAEGRSET